MIEWELWCWFELKYNYSIGYNFVLVNYIIVENVYEWIMN